MNHYPKDILKRVMGQRDQKLIKMTTKQPVNKIVQTNRIIKGDQMGMQFVIDHPDTYDIENIVKERE